MANTRGDDEAKGGEPGDDGANGSCTQAASQQLVVAWGCNNDGQLGLGVKAVGRALDTPTAIPKFRELGVTITKVSASTLAAAWRGWGVWGRVGASQLRDSPQDARHQVSAGSRHVLALDDRGRVYSWGWGQVRAWGARLMPLAPVLVHRTVVSHGFRSRHGAVWATGAGRGAQAGGARSSGNQPRRRPYHSHLRRWVPHGTSVRGWCVRSWKCASPSCPVAHCGATRGCCPQAPSWCSATTGTVSWGWARQRGAVLRTTRPGCPSTLWSALTTASAASAAAGATQPLSPVRELCAPGLVCCRRHFSRATWFRRLGQGARLGPWRVRPAWDWQGVVASPDFRSAGHVRGAAAPSNTRALTWCAHTCHVQRIPACRGVPGRCCAGAAGVVRRVPHRRCDAGRAAVHVGQGGPRHAGAAGP